MIIDTPKASRNKYKFDEEKQLFRLTGILPEGSVFPFDFGNVPSTRGEDGDPLDVLLLMDEPAFVGCLVESRLLGVIEARQTEKRKSERNDRLIAIAADSHTHGDVERLSDLNDQLLDEIEHFFVSYNTARGKEFRPLRRLGPEPARRLVERGHDLFRRDRSRSRAAVTSRGRRSAPRSRKTR